MGQVILTLNAGSSSIKFGLFDDASEPNELASGQVENLGDAARLELREQVTEIGAADHNVAVSAILDSICDLLDGRAVAGVGHRVVHGGINFDAPTPLNPDVMAQLEELVPLAPLHQPNNLAVARAAIKAFPDAQQIACFDTSFHRGHARINDAFAIPRAYYDQGVRRYGFHGLSYDYIAGELHRLHPDLAAGKVVVCHLGNGASMCAMQSGKSVDTSMGFSVLDGLPMGTRPGHLDPGVVLYLMEHEGLTAPEISDILYRESGLKGLSGISHDMRVLMDSDAPEAAQAIDYYVFHLMRELGAMAAALGGLDAVVFCGGIGENAASIRDRVTQGLAWMGVGENIPVLVIKTDEERVIARAVAAAIS